MPRPLVLIEHEDPSSSAVALGLQPWEDLFASSFPIEMPADALIDHYQERLEARRYYGDAFPRWWPNFGPGVVAAFLGGNMECTLTTVWFSPAEEKRIEDTHPEFDDGNPWWNRVRELTRLAVERWEGRAAVGHTDLGGTLDVVASFRTTQRLLYELYDAPEEVERLARQINRLWLRYYDELDSIIRSRCRGTMPWAPVWANGRGYMLQCDFSFMISPKMFERFALPDLAACCDAIDHAFYHLDGNRAIPHLDMLLSLERLRGIQWVPGDGAPPPEAWLPLLKRIRDAGKLCQVSVSPEGARTIARELGGKGFAFYILQAMEKAEAEALIREICGNTSGRRAWPAWRRAGSGRGV